MISMFSFSSHIKALSSKLLYTAKLNVYLFIYFFFIHTKLFGWIGLMLDTSLQ